MAHRLTKTCSEASKEVPYWDIFKNLYVYGSGSGIRTYNLGAMQEIMQEPQHKLKDPIYIHTLRKPKTAILKILQARFS
jgi:hypothetical protein